MRIHQGERIWIKGSNGTGKTTLIKLCSGELIGGLIKYGKDLRIAVSTQEPGWKHGNVKLRFEEESEDLSNSSGLYSKFIKLCNSFDLPEGFDQRPLETLSSGELKKVDIARTLSMDHQLLFLDEPLNYMDVNFRRQLEKTLCESAITVVFVEHDHSFGEEVATRIIDLSSTMLGPIKN